MSNSAFLVRPSISVWKARKLDKQASEKTRAEAGATERAGVRTYKTLVSSKTLEQISQVETAFRNEHRKRTVPWSYEGPGAIAPEGYAGYMECYNAARSKFLPLVEQFLAEYKAEWLTMKADLGALFNESDYPSVDQLRHKFAFELSCEPLANPSDFRNIGGISAEQAAKMESDLRAQLKSATAAAQSAAWDRVIEHVTHMRDRLKEYTGERKGSFRDSLVENLRELVTLLPSLNITGDPELAAMANRIHAELCAEEPDYLRANETARQSVARAAENVLADIWAKRRAAREAA